MGKYDTWERTKKYRDEHIKRITLDVQTETYETWKSYADTHDMKLATLIKTAVNKHVSCDTV